MIISTSQIQNILKIYAENKPVKATKSQATSPSGKMDEVILSTQAQEIGQIHQALKAMPEVREDRVQELSDRVAQGNYSIEAKDVAEKMIGRIMADGLPK